MTLAPIQTYTPTPTTSIIPTGPFEYTVQEGDTCWSIAQKFKIDLTILLAVNNFPPAQCPIVVSQKILIPASGQALPTETPISSNITKIIYIVKPGDTMPGIASNYNITVEQILIATNDYNEKNNLPQITDPAKIEVGQRLIIPLGSVTPTPAPAATSTSAGSNIP